MIDFTTSSRLALTCLEAGDYVVCGQKLNTTFVGKFGKGNFTQCKKYNKVFRD